MSTPPMIADPDLGLADLPEIEFVLSPPGLEPLRRFALVRLDDEGLLYALRSLDDPGVRLLVVPAETFFPDYAPVLGDEDQQRLGIEAAEDALVLVVLQPGTSLQDTTANLLAPVVVNVRTRTAAQVVQTRSDLPLRAPLLA